MKVSNTLLQISIVVLISWLYATFALDIFPHSLLVNIEMGDTFYIKIIWFVTMLIVGTISLTVLGKKTGPIWVVYFLVLAYIVAFYLKSQADNFQIENIINNISYKKWSIYVNSISLVVFLSSVAIRYSMKRKKAG